MRSMPSTSQLRKSCCIFSSEKHLKAYWTIPGLTRELGVGRNWLYQRIAQGKLTEPDVERLPGYRVYLIRNDPDLLARLRVETVASRRYDTTRRTSHS
jgi:hypothetical protein